MKRCVQRWSNAHVGRYINFVGIEKYIAIKNRLYSWPATNEAGKNDESGLL